MCWLCFGSNTRAKQVECGGQINEETTVHSAVDSVLESSNAQDITVGPLISASPSHARMRLSEATTINRHESTPSSEAQFHEIDSQVSALEEMVAERAMLNNHLTKQSDFASQLLASQLLHSKLSRGPCQLVAKMSTESGGHLGLTTHTDSFAPPDESSSTGSPMISRIRSMSGQISDLLPRFTSPSRPTSSLKPTSALQVKLGEVIGRGGFGTVYLGQYNGSTVAIKKMVVRSRESSQRKERMVAMELAISQGMVHENLVQTFTYSMRPLTSSGPNSSYYGLPVAGEDDFLLELVQEYCDSGSLFERIEKSHGLRDDCGRLDYPGLIAVALDICSGMAHLHSHNVCHNDLKAQNVLLSSEGGDKRRAKVVDFGMSFVMDPNQTCVSACRYGTATHMAPEALMDGELSKSSDVYSFGIILAELTSGPVFKSFPLNALTQAIVFKHLRPCFPDDVPAELRSLAERCWRPSPSNRPPFQEILIYLLDIKENFCTTKQYDPPTALVCLPPVVSAYAEEDCGEIHSLGLPFILDAKDAQDAQESQAKVVFASCSDTEFS